ncbi:hypothetical protein FRB90_008813 [Tulasnella sp. 427]|nr:hypothetical protein FRB90_008813 [Tulasnella sp. 427]
MSSTDQIPPVLHLVAPDPVPTKTVTPALRIERHESSERVNEGTRCQDATPKKTQASDASNLGFDFTAAPGADEWHIGGTADGRATYSTADRTVKVEFQKWDW